MKTLSLLKKLAHFFPKKYAYENYDFPGLQIGKLKKDTNCVLVCLDFDEEVYKIMVKRNLFKEVDLIITHHPFIYGTRAKVLKADENKAKLTHLMEKHGIPIYSFHTNFDKGQNGMNDALANKLELKNIHSLEFNDMGRGGELTNPMEIHDFAHYAKEKLGVSYSLLLNYGVKTIKTVSIIGGGGWGAYKDAKDAGYDIYISGDIPHHGRRGVISFNCNYLDMPHEIERIFMKQMSSIIQSFDQDIKIIEIDHEKLPELI